MVQKLNVILITSPELADFRKRLKSLVIPFPVACRILFESFFL